MAGDGIPHGLQEGLLALLALDKVHGTMVAAQLTVEHFDQPYQEFAARLLEHRRSYGEPPGKAHLDDILGWAIERGERAPQLKRLALGLIDLYEHCNPKFIASRAQVHIRRQAAKVALQTASERYHQGGDDDVADIERTLRDFLAQRQGGIAVGTRFGDTARVLATLDRVHDREFVSTGIPAFDKIGVGAVTGQMMLYIGPKGSGKSWFAVHMGVQALSQHKRVLHVSLEMSEAEVTPRYLQRFYSGAMDGEDYPYARFEFNELDKAVGWSLTERKPKPKQVFSTNAGRDWLRKRMGVHGARLNNLIIKDFPSGSLTVPQLQAYLDYLEDAERFTPEVMIVDYPDLMNVPVRDFRLSLGRTYVALNGLLQERGIAGIMPTQGGRKTIGARRVRSSDVSEDIVKVMTAPTVLTYQATPAMQEVGLARVSLEHGRFARSGVMVVIGQAYAIGQWVTDSVLQSSQLQERLENLKEGGVVDDTDDDDDDG